MDGLADEQADKSVKLWDAMTGKCLDTATFGGAADAPVTCVASCFDDAGVASCAATGNFEGAVRVWAVSEHSLAATHATAM